MTRKITASILILFMIFISTYIILQIKAPNLSYYSGKDNGFFVQLQSIVIFSFMFYFIIDRFNKVFFGCLGLISGIISSVIAYLISLANNILFPFIAILISVTIFYIVEKYAEKKYGKS